MSSRLFLLGAILALASYPEMASAQCYGYQCLYVAGARIAPPVMGYMQRYAQCPDCGRMGMRWAGQGAGYVWRHTTWGPAYVTTPRYIRQPGVRYLTPAYGW